MEMMINTNDKNVLSFQNKKLQNATMQIMQIAKVVKGLKESEEPTEEPEETEATEAPQEPETEVSHEEWLRMTFDKITTQELIEELEKRGFYAVKEQGFIKIPSDKGVKNNA